MLVGPAVAHSALHFRGRSPFWLFGGPEFGNDHVGKGYVVRILRKAAPEGVFLDPTCLERLDEEFGAPDPFDPPPFGLLYQFAVVRNEDRILDRFGESDERPIGLAETDGPAGEFRGLDRLGDQPVRLRAPVMGAELVSPDSSRREQFVLGCPEPEVVEPLTSDERRENRVVQFDCYLSMALLD